MFKSVGVSRFTYNWALSRWQEIYREGLKPSKALIKKEFNNILKKKEEFKWLKEASSQTTAQVFEDLNKAFQNFFKGIAEYPKFKSKKRSKESFYVRYDALKFLNGKVNIEKIGKVEYTTNYKIPILDKYNNPRCHYDGKYWYLTFGYEQNENQVMLNQNLSIGIDLGISDLATVNCLDKPIRNINKTSKVRKLKKKLKRLQRKLSRKYDRLKSEKMFKKGERLTKTNNIIKLEKTVKLIHRRLNNIRNNHTHQATNKIVKLNPYRIVMEDLNISGMLKIKHLAKAVHEQNFYEFRRQIEYKAKFNGIEFVLADRFYPSSKMCSCCKTIKRDLRLKDRIFKCSCGFILNRDKNASINLSNYKLA